MALLINHSLYDLVKSPSVWNWLVLVNHGLCLKEGNVLFNDVLNTFYLLFYGVRHMVKDHSDSERGKPLPPHRLLFPSNSIPVYDQGGADDSRVVLILNVIQLNLHILDENNSY